MQIKTEKNNNEGVLMYNKKYGRNVSWAISGLIVINVLFAYVVGGYCYTGGKTLQDYIGLLIVEGFAAFIIYLYVIDCKER
jgi:1,4-dihydroxy-2-naphthoate octaprenyltransferase